MPPVQQQHLGDAPVEPDEPCAAAREPQAVPVHALQLRAQRDGQGASPASSCMHLHHVMIHHVIAAAGAPAHAAQPQGRRRAADRQHQQEHAAAVGRAHARVLPRLRARQPQRQHRRYVFIPTLQFYVFLLPMK